MPIRLKCSCGKVLSVRDELTGKAVKCPGCQKSLRVPGGSAPTKSPAAAKTTAQAKASAPAKMAAGPRPASPAKAAKPAAPASEGSLDDLFNEAGFELRTGKTCPGCFAAMPGDAVLCTQCGLHVGTGDKLKAHKTEFEDEESGEAYLKRAALDMERSLKMQEKMEKGSGMPWWMLGLVLFLLGSVTGVAVISVNIAKREDADVAFDAVSTMLLLAGAATATLAIGAQMVVIYRACMESVKQGLLVLFVPFYILYYGVTRFSEVGKPLLLTIGASAVAGVLFAAAAINQGANL